MIGILASDAYMASLKRRTDTDHSCRWVTKMRPINILSSSKSCCIALIETEDVFYGEEERETISRLLTGLMCHLLIFRGRSNWRSCCFPWWTWLPSTWFPTSTLGGLPSSKETIIQAISFQSTTRQYRISAHDSLPKVSIITVNSLSHIHYKRLSSIEQDQQARISKSRYICGEISCFDTWTEKSADNPREEREGMTRKSLRLLILRSLGSYLPVAVEVLRCLQCFRG